MAQFQVYRNLNRGTAKDYPYLLEVQSNLLSDLRTAVVIPLVKADEYANMKLTRLTPMVEVGGETFILMTHQLAAIDRRSLGKVVADLSSQRSEVVASMDFLISGI